MLPNWESGKPRVCSKFSFFKTSWWMLRVLPQLNPLESSLPYLRAFQWGTVWPCTSRRYCLTLYLQGYQKYDKLKLKVQFLLSHFGCFNFDLSYFWYLLRYRFIQYLIGKLSNMVKMIQKGKDVAALSNFIGMCWKVGIYYINGVLMILNRTPL